MIAGTLYNTEEYANKAGNPFDYMNSIIMIDNYLPIFKIEEFTKKNVEGPLSKITEDIQCRKKYKSALKLSKKILTAVIQLGLGMIGGKADKKFIVISSCNHCKTCGNVCPVGNISVLNTVEYKRRCEGGLACIYLCPQNAIYLKSEKSTLR